MTPLEHEVIHYRDAYEHRDWFGQWHRSALPGDCKAIDIDLLGYCSRCRRGIYLIESTVNECKVHSVLSRHAAESRTLAFVVVGDSYTDPQSVRVKRVWPDSRWIFDGAWVPLARLAQYLLAIRANHDCTLEEADVR